MQRISIFRAAGGRERERQKVREREVAYQRTRDFCASYERKWPRIRLMLYQKLAELMPTDKDVLAALQEAAKPRLVVRARSQEDGERGNGRPHPHGRRAREGIVRRRRRL